MRLIIVNRDAPPSTGVLVATDGERQTEIESFLNELALKYYTPIYGVKWIRDSVRSRLLAAMNAAYEAGRLQSPADRRYGQVWGLDVMLGGALPDAEPFERECITIGWDESFLAGRRYDARIFSGRFRSDDDLRLVLEADGRSSRIHVFRQEVAARVFQRQGGGILEEGAYLLHPKRRNVLVPAANFHGEMLREMVQETHLAIGRLGARSLVVETRRGVSFEGKVIADIEDTKVDASAGGQRRQHTSVEYHWASPTFDPEAALSDAVWIRDNSAVMSIVRQRQATNLVRFEEVATVDTTFAVDLKIPEMFGAGFRWERQSTYRFSVQFFDKRDAVH